MASTLIHVSSICSHTYTRIQLSLSSVSSCTPVEFVCAYLCMCWQRSLKTLLLRFFSLSRLSLPSFSLFLSHPLFFISLSLPLLFLSHLRSRAYTSTIPFLQCNRFFTPQEFTFSNFNIYKLYNLS